jgi:hypothetical protein
VIELAPGERVIVLAGTYREAVVWAQENGLGVHRIIWPRDFHDLRGRPRGVRYVAVGSFWKRPDATEMSAMLRYLEGVRIG